jgi:hypothetical protein
VGCWGAAQECVGLGLEVLHGDAGKGLQHPSGQHRQVAVVAVVVPGDHAAEPAVVAGVGGLPGLAGAQAGVLVGHGGQAAQDEVGLDGHWLLAPQGAVVVEHRHPLLRRHLALPVGVAHGLDELHDRLPGSGVVP